MRMKVWSEVAGKMRCGLINKVINEASKPSTRIQNEPGYCR